MSGEYTEKGTYAADIQDGDTLRFHALASGEVEGDSEFRLYEDKYEGDVDAYGNLERAIVSAPVTEPLPGANA